MPSPSSRPPSPIFPQLQQFLMQGSSLPKSKPVLRGKAQSFTQGTSSKPLKDCMGGSLEFSTLSSSTDIQVGLPHHHRRLSLEQLLEYTREVLEQVYVDDSLKVRARCLEFMRERGGELKGKLQERLSLLKYLEESLKYRSFAEVEVEAVKEWRKNALFFSLATLWGHCMLGHQFKDSLQLAGEYDRFRNFIANITQFYFRGSLRILGGKGVDSYGLFYEETAHQIIGGLREWKEINGRLIELLEGEAEGEINLEFDLSLLQVNPHYLRPALPQNQLPQTTALISQLTMQYRVNEKIALLKKIRTAFLQEITESNKRIVSQLKLTRVGQFQKDDILDCMIYCIIRGQLRGVGHSLQGLQLLVGKDSGLLSKRGVDSYRADLVGAVEYLRHDQTSPLIKLPKKLMSTRLTYQ